MLQFAARTVALMGVRVYIPPMTSDTTQIQVEDFRFLLQQELLKRTTKNPKYSMRAFALHLGVSSPVLSHLLAGRRPLTEKLIFKFSQSLGLPPNHVHFYISMLQKNTSSSGKEAMPFSTLSLDTFHVISDWYHDAILELTHIPHFQPKHKWIARALGISVNEVSVAVERLVRLKLLSVDQNNKWQDNSRDNTTQAHPDISSVALRKYQEKILELSLESLRNVPKSQRDHTSTMTAIDSSDLDEIKNRIKRFRKELSDFLQRDGIKPNQIYQLSVSYFPLTKIEQENPGEQNEYIG
ncbi:MAG: TIGR02147 family protein [Bdellovibrionales bacterium]